MILKLLSEEPSYGYQLMKTMEERLAGGYAPSAGVIYPTLTMLEEAGLIVASSSEGARKTRAARGRLTEDQIRQAAEIIAAAARAIDEL